MRYRPQFSLKFLSLEFDVKFQKNLKLKASFLLSVAFVMLPCPGDVEDFSGPWCLPQTRRPRGCICVLSHRIIDLRQMALELETEASWVGLKINVNKTKVLSLICHRTLPICVVALLQMTVASNSMSPEALRALNRVAFSIIWICRYLNTNIKLRFSLCCDVGEVYGKVSN